MNPNAPKVTLIQGLYRMRHLRPVAAGLAIFTPPPGSLLLVTCSVKIDDFFIVEYLFEGKLRKMHLLPDEFEFVGEQ